MTQDHADLFGHRPAGPEGPEGLRYWPDLLDPSEEQDLLEEIARLPFAPFEFHGYLGRRRVVSFGHRYDFGDERLRVAAPIPAFMEPVRERVAARAALPAQALEHVLVTEYAPGAGIGWHRDKAVFAEVIGVSLRAACTFRLRRKVGPRWERHSFLAEPRSAYLLSGSARQDWEHSIPPVDALRYSLTFRRLRPR